MNVSDTSAPLFRFRFCCLRGFTGKIFSGLVIVLSLLMVTAEARAQALSDMPSVERIKAEIQGTDATDTQARQVAVCTYLVSYVERVKYNRTARGPFTPEEQKLYDGYRLAAYQISQDYAKTHTPAEAQAFERLHGRYEMDSAFYQDWSKRLIGKQAAATYKQAESELGARQQKHIEAEKKVYEEAKRASTAGPGGLSNDPTAVAARRCLELGGGTLACVGKGMGAGMFDMLGFKPEELTGPGAAGVVLSGTYRNPATSTSLNFSETSVSISGCGKLVADGHNYVIEKTPGMAYRVEVANQPAAIMLAERQGGLLGPGAVDVSGRIIVGYHTVTNTLYANGAPAYGCGGPNNMCQSSTVVPDYAPKIERCVIGPMAAPPPVRATAPPPPSAAESSGLLGMLTSTINIGDTGWPAVPGLRMVGSYEGRLLAEFTPASVVMDCGEAHARMPYTVEEAANGFVVRIDNPAGPVMLAVSPDGTLHGTGTATVNGRLVSGMKGDDVTFRPHTETCEVGVLRPKAGSGRTMKMAER